MLLNFIGTGSAFNTELGNNSAYFEHKDVLYIIDCGETVFSKIKDKINWGKYSNVTVLITHSHTDHIGSLPTLIFYLYYIHGIKTRVLTGDGVDIVEFLQLSGVLGKQCEVYSLGQIKDIDDDDIKYCKEKGEVIITSFENNHVDEIPSNCFNIIINGNVLLFSGDSKDVVDVDFGVYDEIYHDCSSAGFEGSVHCYIESLIDKIPKEFHNKVYLMHLDNEDKIREILKERNCKFNICKALI